MTLPSLLGWLAEVTMEKLWTRELLPWQVLRDLRVGWRLLKLVCTF